MIGGCSFGMAAPGGELVGGWAVCEGTVGLTVQRGALWGGRVLALMACCGVGVGGTL